MRILALAPFFGVSMLWAADVASPLMPYASQVLQGGALAVLAWVVWYILSKSFPAHAKALKDQREDFLRILKEDRDSLERDRRELTRLSQEKK
jgi:hypothetical protein